MLLEINNISIVYADVIQVLKGVSLKVDNPVIRTTASGRGSAVQKSHTCRSIVKDVTCAWVC